VTDEFDDSAAVGTEASVSVTDDNSSDDGPAGGSTGDDGTTGDEPPHAGGRGKGISRTAIEWTILIVAAVVIAVVIKSFLFQAFYIPSASMEPTLEVGDRVLVNKLSYDLHDVHRGDIVVFKRPPLEMQDFPDLVKRVIGLPGDSVSSKDGHIYINGKLLNEPWLPDSPSSYTGALPDDQHPQFNMPGPVKVPAGQYFVMGDNRTDSEDSRFFGTIPKGLIVGRAMAVVWPLGQIKGV
jgi:signal peptidase I